MASAVRQLLFLQLVLVAATSAVFLVIFEILSAVSVCYGGGIAAVNALLVARCSRRDTEAAGRSPQQSLTAVYICVIQRFLLIALLFGLGLGVLTLKPLGVLAGFIAGQLMMIYSGYKQLVQK